jgi:hypothetical protein
LRRDQAAARRFRHARAEASAVTSEATRTHGIGRTVRLVADLVRGAEHTRGSAAKLLGVKEPAAARQLEAIEANLPGIKTRETGRGRVYYFSTRPSAKRPPLGTAIAACFGASLAPLFEGTSYEQGLRDATRSVVERAKRAGDFKNIDRKFFFHARGGEVALPDAGPHLDELIEAVLVCNWVRLAYRHFDTPPSRVDIRPLSIVVYEHQLYVVGLDKTGRHHPYRFSRIESVTRSSTTFEYPARPAYDPKQLLRDSFGIFMDPSMPVIEARVKLAPRWKAYASTHRWHPSQACEELDDGVVVTLRVRLCPELERWVLGFGDDAEVLAPQSLRDRIAGRLERAALAYRAGPSRHGNDPASTR